jgi:hypothetical protein
METETCFRFHHTLKWKGNTFPFPSFLEMESETCFRFHL